MKSSEAINIAVSCVMTSGLRMPEKREVIDSLRKMELETEELERKLSDVSELIETESYTDHIKCQDVVCITPLLEVIEFEE